jgi:hypothetical protein
LRYIPRVRVVVLGPDRKRALARSTRVFSERVRVERYCKACRTPFNFADSRWKDVPYCSKECVRLADLERRRNAYTPRSPIALDGYQYCQYCDDEFLPGRLGA